MNEEDDDLPDFLEPPADDDEDDDDEEAVRTRTRAPVIDEDEALAETARGHFTSDEADAEVDRLGEHSEIDAMGRAAGVVPESADGRVERHK